MAQYQTGTVAVTLNSNIVTGTGTVFATNVQVGNSFKVSGVNAIYTIISVDSNTQVKISPNYAGATASGVSYQIGRDFTPNLGLAEISTGDSEFAYHLTTEVIRKLDTAVAGKCTTTGPGAGQAFTVGGLTSQTATTNEMLVDATNAAANARLVIRAGTGAASNKYCYIHSKHNDSNGQSWIYGTYGSDKFVIRDAKASADRLTVSTDGSTTIGDANGGVLYVGNTSATQGRLSYSAAGNTTWYFDNSTNSSFASTQFRMKTSAAAVNALTLLGDGKVLVGTATDNGTGAKLQVEGSITAGSTSQAGTLKLYGGSTYASYPFASFSVNGVRQSIVGPIGVIEGNSSTELGLFAETGLGIRFYTGGSGTARACISPAGNFLIGPTTDNTVSKLQISGQASLWCASMNGSGATSQSYGLSINAGTNSSDTALLVRSQDGSVYGLKVLGNGTTLVGTASDNGSGAKLQVNGSATFLGCASWSGQVGMPIPNNYDISLDFSSNTQVRIRMRGTDGVVRTGYINIS